MPDLFVPYKELDQLAEAAFESERKTGGYGSVPVTWETIGAELRESYRRVVLAILRARGASS